MMIYIYLAILVIISICLLINNTMITKELAQTQMQKNYLLDKIFVHNLNASNSAFIDLKEFFKSSSYKDVIDVNQKTPC